MKQPKKLKKQPNLKRRLDAVRSQPEPDVTFMVTLPADVYRALEAAANAPVPEWVAQTLADFVEDELLTDETGPSSDGVGKTRQPEKRAGVLLRRNTTESTIIDGQTKDKRPVGTRASVIVLNTVQAAFVF